MAIIGSLLLIGVGVYLFVRLRNTRTGSFDLTSPRMAARMRAASDAGNLLSKVDGTRGEAIGLAVLGPASDLPRTPPGSRMARITSTGKPVLLFDGNSNRGTSTTAGDAVGFGLNRHEQPKPQGPKRVFRFDMGTGSSQETAPDSSDDEDFGITLVTSRQNRVQPVLKLQGPDGSATQTRDDVANEPGESDL